MPLLARRRRQFEVPVHDLVLRVTGPEHLYEQARAAGMQFSEQVQAYAINNPSFRTSRRPLEVPEDAPPIVRDMARLAGRAGIGPILTFQGALLEFVGRVVAQAAGEVVVSCDGDYYVVSRKRARLPVHAGVDGRGALAVVVKPELGPHGVHTTAARSHLTGQWSDSLVVVAESCILADAAMVGASSILTRSRSLRAALDYLRGIEGVHGALIVRGERIGVAGSLELAA